MHAGTEVYKAAEEMAKMVAMAVIETTDVTATARMAAMIGMVVATYAMTA